jgi:hypothetical protein
MIAKGFEKNPNLRCPKCKCVNIDLLPIEYEEQGLNCRGYSYGTGRQKPRLAHCNSCGYTGLANGPEGFLDNKYHVLTLPKIGDLERVDFIARKNE